MMFDIYIDWPASSITTVSNFMFELYIIVLPEADNVANTNRYSLRIFER